MSLKRKYLSGEEIIKELVAGNYGGATVKVSLINQISRVYDSVEDRENDLPLGDDVFITLDYDNYGSDDMHTFYGAWCSDECEDCVSIGFSKDCIIGWLEPSKRRDGSEYYSLWVVPKGE